MENFHPQSKLLKIKVFKAIQKNCAMLGISAKLMSQPYPLNKKILMDFIVLGTAITFICVYIFNDAETFPEYTQSTSIYFASVLVLLFLILAILILRIDLFFEFIDRCDSILNTRECK